MKSKWLMGIGFMVYYVSSYAFETSKVDLENILSKLKIKARVATGFFDSGDDGSFKHGSFEIPDVKIWMIFSPDDMNLFTFRFNMNNGTAQSPLLDYMFFQSKDFIPFLKGTPFSLTTRVGRFKQFFGEETQSNNPVEGSLPSNSAFNATVIDEGVELSTKFCSLGLVNGSRGTQVTSTQAKGWMAKLFYTFFKSFNTSASYYDSGHLKASNSEMSIAGISSPPARTTDWRRRMWEIDLRYDHKKADMPLYPVSGIDGKFMIRMAYGQFEDKIVPRSHLRGQFGYVEGVMNLFKRKIYIATRESFIDLKDGHSAALNGVTANHYWRYSFGGGYRWSENTHVKVSYDINETGSSDDNLLSAILAVRL